MKTMKKAVLAMLTVGLVVGGVAGVALAGHNNPNLEATGHPGYAPDYYYSMSAPQPGPAQNTRRDLPSSPYWNAEGAGVGTGNSQMTASRTPNMVPFAS
jgi:hypothetical protein